MSVFKSCWVTVEYDILIDGDILLSCFGTEGFGEGEELVDDITKVEGTLIFVD